VLHKYQQTAFEKIQIYPVFLFLSKLPATELTASVLVISPLSNIVQVSQKKKSTFKRKETKETT